MPTRISDKTFEVLEMRAMFRIVGVRSVWIWAQCPSVGISYCVGNFQSVQFLSVIETNMIGSPVALRMALNCEDVDTVFHQVIKGGLS